jgi:hypothetical protein
MLPLIILVAALAVVWRLGYWPFASSFKYLPSYGQFRQNKAAVGRGPAPAATPARPTL